MLAHNRQIFIDQKSLVNNVDFKLANVQTTVAEFKLVRRSDNRRIPFSFKILAKEFKLFLRGHALKIDNRDTGRAICLPTEELLVAIEQHLQHQRSPFESPHAVPLRKGFHYGQFLEDLESSIRVSYSGGAFAIQLDKGIGFIGQKRIEARSRRNRSITRIDLHQLAFCLTQTKLVEQRTINDRGVLHFFDRAPDGFADRNDVRKIIFSHKMRPQIWRKPAASEDEFCTFKPLRSE